MFPVLKKNVFVSGLNNKR